MRPLTDDEKAEWEGWAEVESEPVCQRIVSFPLYAVPVKEPFPDVSLQAMFNIILAKLGVPNVRAKELFTCENWDLSYLP